MAMKASKTAATRMAPRECGVRRFCKSAGSGTNRFQTPFSIRPMALRRAPRPPIARPNWTARLPSMDSASMSPRVRRDLAAPAPRGMVKCCMQRDDVGEALVQRQHVGVGRLVEAAVHAVEDGVGGLVGDDVVRQAGVDAAAGHVVAGVVRRGLEVAEQQRDLLRAVEGVGLPERVRADGQLLDEAAVVVGVLRVRPGPPEDGAAERALEVLDRLHRHGVDHLLVELRVALRGRPAVLREQARVVQVDGLVPLARGVHVLDGEVLADRPLLASVSQRILSVTSLIVGGGEPRREARVHGVDADAAVRRVADGGLRVADRRAPRGRRRR